MDKLENTFTTPVNSESIRQKLKILAKEHGRPFDEILRYFAMERFLYRLSVSSYVENFFLKGGLMLKALDSMDHRATMDIDLLGRTSNQIENVHHIISEISDVTCEEDAIVFDTKKLILRKTQTAADYHGVSISFAAKLCTSRIPILIDVGFNDIVIPKPQTIQYPTMLGMSEPKLLGYTLETIIAEKLESIVKLALVNTRMKDFYNLWTILRHHEIENDKLRTAIAKVFANRGTVLKHPIAFTPIFYGATETNQQWNNFLASIKKSPVNLKDVVQELSRDLAHVFPIENQ